MFLGIDVGSVSTDAVLLDKNLEIMAYSIVKSRFNHKVAIEAATNQVCQAAGIQKKDVVNIVGTGYGRKNVEGAVKVVTEISCHAMGVKKLFPEAEFTIDIGGQDSKVIKLTQDGYVETFIMNDKCAAGTGRFLEVMAAAIGIEAQSLGQLSEKARHPQPISSICTVFAESEVITKIAEGCAVEDIIAGIHNSIGEKILGMAASIGLKGSICLTGGVAKNTGVVQAIASKTKFSIHIPEEPQIVGALGAALYGGRIA